ncbi:hypothetical protein GF340_01945 [Candidatus Peregrinibacteria bacterium]|nr:hypothetical protein [Candidatus Peregrinibacteria bacterium]
MKKGVTHYKSFKTQIQSFSILILFVLIGAGVYGYFQYQDYAAARSALKDGQTKLAELQAMQDEVSDEYSEIKNTYDENFKDVNEAIEAVFPPDEFYTKLTETLDRYILDLDEQGTQSNDTIFMGNLKFSRGKYDAEKGYSVLPFTLTLEASRENFTEFLKYIETSGSLDDGTRLMEVQSISLSFPTSEVETVAGRSLVEGNILNVTLALNAYYQAPPQA